MVGCVADFFVLLWGFLYWNFRKTTFRLRPDRRACPCQKPSDSGRAMETGCEASFALNRPERFRHVCPLLKSNAERKWRCAVDTPYVRPYWSRAIAVYVCLALSLWFAGVTSAFVLFRTVGYAVHYRSVAWPPKWPEIDRARSRYFVEKAQRALATRKTSEALMCLILAYRLDPGNYAAGMTAAQLYQTNQPALSDQYFGLLMRDHPDHRPAILAAWYRALLNRGDFTAIKGIAMDGFAFDPGHTEAWLHALVFATRRQPTPSVWKTILQNQALPGEVRRVAELEIVAAEKAAPDIRAALNQQVPEPDMPYLDYYVPRRLLDLGFAQDALHALERAHTQTTPRDILALRLDAIAALGWSTVGRNEIETLLALPLTATVVEVLCAHLIRYPDAQTLDELLTAIEHRPLSPKTDYSAYTALVCAAGAAEDRASLDRAIACLKQGAGGPVRAIDSVHAFFQGARESRLESYLPLVQPLPIEVTYAMFERYYRRRGPASTPATR